MKSGRTPLLRAKKLEDLLDVGEIYLKMEGNNPTGHKHDRVAEVIIKDAQAHGYNQLLVNGSMTYVKSVVYMAQQNDMKVVVPLFKNERWKKTQCQGAEVIDFRNEKVELPIVFLKSYAESHQYYLSVQGVSQKHLSQMVLEEMAEEIVNKLTCVSSIFTQLSFGYTMTSLYNVVLKQWMKGNYDALPMLSAGTWESGNDIYAEYLKRYQIQSDSLGEIPENLHYNRTTVETTLQAIDEASGEIIPIQKQALKEAKKKIKKIENVEISENEAYGLAAFFEMVEQGKLKKGTHVIVLNDGKSQVMVEDIKDFDAVSQPELIAFTRQWLDQYSDSVGETEDAIQNAMDKGHILLAKRHGVYEGICVIVHMGFQRFIPTYHIAYIGTMKSSKGRGVGSELIQKAIELTEGNVSLHVDLDNRSAKKFYEKYGFEHVYNRMIHKRHH